MKHFAGIRAIVLSGALVVFGASVAQAQALRTWVSGVGDDANPCSRTAPCKTFAGAISKTAAGGYIDALDPGGYGTVTITKSITIDGGGYVAGVLAAGVSGINVNGSGIIVHLRNLSLESSAAGTGGTRGVEGVNVFDAAEVHIEHCVINGFENNAVNFHPPSGSLFVLDTWITGNSAGGIAVATGRASIEHLRATGNGNGVVVIGAALVTVRDSYAAGGSVGFAAIVNSAAVLNIESSVATNNSIGVQVNSGATARLSNTTLVSNSSTGLSNDGISFLVSLQGNSVFGNPTNGSFTSTQVKQ